MCGGGEMLNENIKKQILNIMEKHYSEILKELDELNPDNDVAIIDTDLVELKIDLKDYYNEYTTSLS